MRPQPQPQTTSYKFTLALRLNEVPPAAQPPGHQAAQATSGSGSLPLDRLWPQGLALFWQADERTTVLAQFSTQILIPMATITMIQVDTCARQRKAKLLFA